MNIYAIKIQSFYPFFWNHVTFWAFIINLSLVFSFHYVKSALYQWLKNNCFLTCCCDTVKSEIVSMGTFSTSCISENLLHSILWMHLFICDYKNIKRRENFYLVFPINFKEHFKNIMKINLWTINFNTSKYFQYVSLYILFRYQIYSSH